MSKQSSSMVSTKSKNKVLSCSTPEHHQVDSPTRDSDSEAASPVPFLCTQDGAEGETDVVWNFYTPKSNQNIKSHHKSTTPLSRRTKKLIRPRLIEKQLPKRRPLKVFQKRNELFQDLIELNQNLQDLIPKKPQNGNCIIEKRQSVSEDDFITESPEFSPKNALKSSSHCLRKNVLSSYFGKPDPDTALESDDSMNECLIKASQIVEDNLLNCEPIAKRTRYETNSRNSVRTELNFKMDNDSMDSILNRIKLESPAVIRAKKCYSPSPNNDSFDSLVGNLNDSVLEQLSQMPVKINMSNQLKKAAGGDWTVKELVVHDGSPTKSLFGRHNSMPESPSITNVTKPSTSGMVFGRYNSMPFENPNKSIAPSDSPIRCTPDEIKKKHQLAREKLLAKRLFPYASSQTTQNTQSLDQQPTQVPQPPVVSKKVQFRPKVASSTTDIKTKILPVNASSEQKTNSHSLDLRLLIEKKRQEALMKLRRRQPQNNKL